MKRDKLLLNDLHLGVIRSSGTTIATALALRNYLLESFGALLLQHTDKDVIINGDLFDQFNVPLQDVLEAYLILCAWLDSAAGTLSLGRGNHDIAKDNSKTSSFDFLCALLKARYGGDRVIAVTEPMMIDEGIYMIPHMPNQALFDLELSRVPADAMIVLLHANYDNHFAVESDHSLNVSEEQAKVLAATGLRLIFGHEHQARTALDGRVIVTGNQWPSSVADCLGNPDGLKHAAVLRWPVAAAERWLTPIQTWNADTDFAIVNWRELSTVGDARFIRIAGTAANSEAGDVVSTIAKFRQASKALVITNAVQVEGVGDMDSLSVSMEEVKTFDVWAYLLEQLTIEQADTVKRLRAPDSPQVSPALEQSLEVA